MTIQDQYAHFLKGKRVVVVGPAGYLKGQRRGFEIDSYDVVVKLNWGETLPAGDYGRTDVLYKRLLKLGHADEVLVQDYVDAGMKFLIGVETRQQVSQEAKLKAIVGDKIPWFIDHYTRGKVMQQMHGSPLLGACAVFDLLQHKVESVHVMGCDFYATGYAEDYGGKPYRAYMRRTEGTIGRRHDVPEQRTWLRRVQEQDSRLTFDQELEDVLPKPVKPEVAKPKKAKKRKGIAAPRRTFEWHPGNVSSTKIPDMVIRTFIEQQQLTKIVGLLTPYPQTAAEVGAGFGRMTIALAAQVGTVTAYERASGLVQAGRRLVDVADWQQVQALAPLPAYDQAFDLVMSFTVLQHLSHEEAEAVTAEMARLARYHVLIVEDTDVEYHMKDKADPTHFTFGRSADWYQANLGRHGIWERVLEEPRRCEPGYKGTGFRGHYLLFRRVS